MAQVTDSGLASTTDAEVYPIQIASRPTSSLLTFVGLCLSGLWFGALFERSHVFEPTSIRQQFVFKKWIMIKMFMGAVAGSAFSFYLIHRLSPSRFQRIREKKLLASYPSVILGSFLLGIGMCTAGACPGMVLPQVGSGVQNAWVTLLGGFAGALTYNMLIWIGATKYFAEKSYSSEEDQLQAEYVELRLHMPTWTEFLMLALGVACALFAAALELIVPFRSELLDYNASNPDWKDGALPPSICGLGIGCINIAMALLVEGCVGSSNGYAQLMGKDLMLKQKSPATSFVKAYWQVPYLMCAIVGALVSAMASNNFPNRTPGIDNAGVAFTGGFLMLFGSRLGTGCTSGHGICGMPMLNLKSMVGCCCMFAGAIATGVLLELNGELALE